MTSTDTDADADTGTDTGSGPGRAQAAAVPRARDLAGRVPAILRRRDFRRYWIGHSVSLFLLPSPLRRLRELPGAG